MAQPADHQMQWTLGKARRRPDGGTDLHRWRPVSDAEAEQLQASSRLVRDLGSQRDFQSLVAAVERWRKSIDRVRERLTAGHALPKAVVTAATLDLTAMGHAAVRCVQSVLASAQSLHAQGHADTEHTAAVEAGSRFLQTRQAFLTCSALAPEARDGKIAFTLDGSAVHVAGLTAFDAADFGRALLGEVGGCMVASVGALAEAIAEPARQLEALVDDVPDGVIPDLVRVEGGDRPSRETWTFAELSIAQAVALRRFSERLDTLTPSQFAGALFEVMNASARQQVAIGSVNVSSASESARANTAVNELPHAELTLEVDLLGSAPVDFWSAVTFDVVEEGVCQRLFAGAVQDASGPVPLALDCEGGVELTEHNRGSIAAAGVEAAELVTTIMRQIGLPEDTITLSSTEHGPQALERFDVFVPVRGLTVTDPLTVGRITIAPVSDGQQPLGALDLSAEHLRSLIEEYRDATAYAVASVEADGLDVAEEQGYAAVETTMAWLVARQRYGFLRLPDGTAQAFSRTQALQSVRYASVVLVRGETTGRQWLRWVHDVGQPAARDLTNDSDLLRPELPEELHPSDERALRALMRAVNEPGLQQQVQALSEALENYVAGVTVPHVFSDSQLDALRKLTPDWLNEDQQEKFAEAIKGLNGTPFRRRLSERLDCDGVPLTPEEHELLFKKLRAARNDVAHGKAIKKPPTRDEVLRGISIVSRALMFGIAARAQTGEITPS